MILWSTKTSTYTWVFKLAISEQESTNSLDMTFGWTGVEIFYCSSFHILPTSSWEYHHATRAACFHTSGITLCRLPSWRTGRSALPWLTPFIPSLCHRALPSPLNVISMKVILSKVQQNVSSTLSFSGGKNPETPSLFFSKCFWGYGPRPPS